MSVDAEGCLCELRFISSLHYRAFSREIHQGPFGYTFNLKIEGLESIDGLALLSQDYLEAIGRK